MVIVNQILNQKGRFKYLRCDISYKSDTDWEGKLAKFRSICGTIHRCLKGKTRKDTGIEFYKTMAVPEFMHDSETWIPGGNRA